MPTERLIPHFVRKPWGVHNLPKWLLPLPAEEKIGEVCYQKQHADGSRAALLVKYLMTSGRLSVQVHPDDSIAAESGLAAGKSECWYVVDATPPGEIALGLARSLTPAEAEAASLDGSIVDALAWRKVGKGDFLFAPAGTVHAIGAGCTLVEIQQNADVTYRLYDYGRPRELHLEEGLAASNLAAGVPQPLPEMIDRHRRLLVCDPHFVIERWEIEGRRDFRLRGLDELWLIVLAGIIEIQGARFRTGEIAFHSGEDTVAITGPEPVAMLVAYPGGKVERDLLFGLAEASHPLWDEGHDPGIEPGDLGATG